MEAIVNEEQGWGRVDTHSYCRSEAQVTKYIEQLNNR